MSAKCGFQMASKSIFGYYAALPVVAHPPTLPALI